MIKRFLRLAALTAAAACGESLNTGGPSRTQVLLTDDPFPYGSIARVNVYVKDIAASTTLDTTNGLAPAWVTMAEPRRTFNLLDFQGGVTALAGEADIPAGQYRAIRLVINTDSSHVIGNDQAEVPVHWPVHGELTLFAYVESALDVTSAGARIIVDFDVGRTFVPDGSGGFFFIPWIRAVTEGSTGTITGTVTGPDIEGGSVPLADVAVIAYASGPGVTGAIVGTARTGAGGHYVMGYILAGHYGVTAQSPAAYAFHGSATFVEVKAGEVVTADIVMSRDSAGTNPDTTHTSPGGPVAAVSIRVGTPSGSTSVNAGDSIPLAAELRNADGAMLLGRSVTWSVSDSSVAWFQGLFGQYATLRAQRAGTTTVSATSEGKTASVTFTVSGTAPPPRPTEPVASVTLSFTPPLISAAHVGDSIGVTARLFDSSGGELFGRSVTFASSDSTVVAIQGVFGQYAIVRPSKAGSATISAASEGKTGSGVVTVQ